MRYNTVRVVEFLVVYETISSCRLSLLHSLQYGFSFYSVYICTAVLILVFCLFFFFFYIMILLHSVLTSRSQYKNVTFTLVCCVKLCRKPSNTAFCILVSHLFPLKGEHRGRTKTISQRGIRANPTHFLFHFSPYNDFAHVALQHPGATQMLWIC